MKFFCVACSLANAAFIILFRRFYHVLHSDWRIAVANGRSQEENKEVKRRPSEFQWILSPVKLLPFGH